ncbi:MAG: hormogonium polysaccharide biosynthesis protein HpsA, partial [Cyanobacteriota bacterium]|nr:hormogonium polysaccharide biosynthesis protein HpsA [Cyanobacteriota bacterium]
MPQFRRTPKPLIQTIPKRLRRLGKRLASSMQKRVNWVLHRAFILGRRSPRGTAGFILPTAVMVILVVSLLTTAIVIRSTDRAKNASNYRVNQVTLNASLPAIERAKQKIDDLFSDPTLPQGAPSDISLYNVLKQDKYDLGDETRLRVAFDINNSGQINLSTPGQTEDIGSVGDEFSRTAWRFPVDTDNDGSFDSFTLYGIYFRTPMRDPTGFNRSRTPLESRTPPQDNSGLTGFCAAAAGTSASLVGADGWYKSGANLKKSFYVYTATVPITNPNELGLSQQYREYQGNQGFTSLEYQQDRVKIPFGNNAVVYEDDLDLFSGTPLRINGRIITSSNLLASSFKANGDLRLYQVSSDDSCFYEEENGKILVGGNVGFEAVGAGGLGINFRNVTVDLFKGRGNDPQPNGGVIANAITQNNTSVTNSTDDLAYNNQAYEERIAFLVNAVLARNPANPIPGYPACQTTQTCQVPDSYQDPEAVKENIERRVNEDGADPTTARVEELETWFRDRTRRVPYREIAFGADSIGSVTLANAIQDYSTDRLRPREDWMYPTGVNATGKTGQITGPTGLTLKPEQLAATDPELRNNEDKTGDRILTGNNLPALFYNKSSQQFEANVGEFTEEQGRQFIDGTTKWREAGPGNQPPSPNNRYRKSQVAPSIDVGQTDRNGSWEADTAKEPLNRLDDVGGLRIVTGAGVYLTATPANNAATPNMSKVVWPDWMPAIPDAARNVPNATLPANSGPPWLPDTNGDTNLDLNTDLVDRNGDPRPFLRMRASAVYHYRHREGKEPIACVSSYYDPTDSTTAQNRSGGLPAFGGSPAPLRSGEVAQVPAPFAAAGGQSNNGVTYRVAAPLAIPRNDPQLLQQAELVYPNGRLVNPLLRSALSKNNRNQRTLAENAAVDSTVCALRILRLRGGALVPNPATLIGQLPHGAIQEVAFLDGREVKQLEWDDPRTVGRGPGDSTYSAQPNADTQSGSQTGRSEYDLPIELRQPLE